MSKVTKWFKSFGPAFRRGDLVYCGNSPIPYRIGGRRLRLGWKYDLYNFSGQKSYDGIYEHRLQPVPDVPTSHK